MRRGPTSLLVARALTVAAVCGIALILALVADPGPILIALAEKATMMLPGVLLVRAVAGPAAGWLPVAVFGPLLGVGISALVMLGLWATGGRGLWLFLAAPGVALALVPFAHRVRERWPFPQTAPGDRAALAGLLLIVPLVVGAPFAHVGKEVRVGKAYRAYFTADYVWRRAVVAELAKGDLPPVNPFYRDDALHYYWLPHLPSAVSYRNGHADLDEVLLTNSVFTDVAFVAFLFGLARSFVPVPSAAAAGVASVILASSFEGAFALLENWQLNQPLSLVRYLNIDAVTRWRFHGMPIDGLQRVLFYQPHHALGYALGFMGVLAVTGRRRRFDPTAFAIAGVLLGLSTLVSSFAGLMLTCVAALWEGCSVLRWREWWRAAAHLAAASLPLALAAAVVTALQYVDQGGNIISIGANSVALNRVWVVTLLSFGPVLMVSALAAWILLRRRDGRGAVFAALWVTCAAFYFFVDIRDHQDVYVGWRVGHLWFVGSTALAAIVFMWLAVQPLWTRRLLGSALGALILIALPTTIIDIYNTQDIYNWAQGPGFFWTLILSHEDQELFAWVKANTLPCAVFQIDPVQRGVEGWAYLPAFAERRMGVGLPISMVPLRKYEQGSARASWIFETGSAESAHKLARRNGIQYLLLGTPERKRHPSAQARFDAAPEFFEPVFRNHEATIYRVR